MAASYIAIIVCSLLGPALAQGVNLSAEIWAVVGVAAGVVIIIVAFIWIIFCVMLYRHQKEREDDEDHEVKQNMNERRKKRKRRQRREESRENELTTTSTESGYVQYPTSEDLWNVSDDIQRQDTIPPAAQLPDINADTPSPDTPPAPASEPQPAPSTTSEPADLTPVPSPMATKPYTPVPEIFESIFTPPTNASEEEDHRRGLHVRLSANVSTSRLRKLSDVEECEVQPDVSNFPLRYGQRRISSTARPVSDYGSGDPFSFSFGPSLLGRNRSQKEEVINGTSEFEKRPRHITDHKDIMFGQLCLWPEFNNY